MAGTNSKRPNIETAAPIIILVEPQLAENIGMAARAMANFGLRHLRLVRPREAFPNEKAIAAAAKADYIIDNAVLYDSLEAALVDMRYVVATTARERSGFKPVLSAVEAAAILRRKIQPQSGGEGETAEIAAAAEGTAAILFGRERFGLSNAELSLADDLVTFPVNPAFASLNIAQAVLLMAYEWMKSGLKTETETAFRGPPMETAEKADLHGLFHRLEEALDARGYFRPLARKPIMVENLRAVLTRAGFSAAELRLLSGVIDSLDRFARKAAIPAGAEAACNESEAAESQSREEG